MKYRKLGKTDLQVSQICLGSMTWGSQNSESEAHQQMDFAVDHGVNFIDTAEAYPTTPSSAENLGRTEEYIGTWLEKSGKRADVVLATKVAGGGAQNIREGAPLSPASIREAIDGSLKRLKTDFIDLYQLHWPNRGHYHFRRSWTYDPTGQDRDETRAHVLEILQTLQELIDQGKIRHIGLSNETCWGTSQFLDIAAANRLPRVESIQNEYSLLQRIFDLDLAELSHNEDVGLLAYSPLAAGFLSGKYQDGAVPKGSRRSINETLGGRFSSHSIPAADAYIAAARKHDLDPGQMALAFCLTRPFMTSVIIGATNLEQLRINIDSVNLHLSEAVMADIQNIYRQFPVPF